MGKFWKTIAIPLNTGTKVYTLPTQSGMNSARILTVIPRKNGKTFNEQLLPNDALFSAIQISFRNSTGLEVIENLPLELISIGYAATAHGHSLDFTDLDWASCTLTVQDANSIPANTAVELTFCFEK